MLKFNIDGASRGNPNLSGIGGVLRKGRARFWGVSMWSRVEGFNEGTMVVGCGKIFGLVQMEMGGEYGLEKIVRPRKEVEESGESMLHLLCSLCYIYYVIS